MKIKQTCGTYYQKKLKIKISEELGLKKFFSQLKGLIDNKVQENGAQYTAFALFGIFNYPVYYFIWIYLSKQPYSNLWLRIVATLLCLGLLLNKYWPKKFKEYLPVYWYVTLTYCLPFFFAFMLVRNNFSSMWLANSILVFYFLISLVDFKSFTVLFLIGTGLGLLLGYTLPSSPSINNSQDIDYWGIIITYLVSFIIGGIFARNKYKIEQAKLETLRAVGATIAHELRTPLSSIQFAIGGSKNYLPLLVDAYEKAKANNLSIAPIQSGHLKLLAHVFDSIESELDYFDTIINIILINVKEGISTTDFKSTSMRDCIAEALERYPFDHEQEKLIQWSDQDDFLFWGDEMLMIHVIFNLMKNALYFIDKAGKGKITIECGSTEKGNVLYFKDTGTGIRAHAIPKLFQRFYTDTQHGTGLGLAYCKMVMTSFRGSIDCKSEYGKFTLFEMFFPKVKGMENTH